MPFFFFLNSFFKKLQSDAFQEDIYPDTFAGVPSLTADEWLAGENRPPVLRSLRPGEGGPEAEAKAFAPPKSALQLQAEVMDPSFFNFYLFIYSLYIFFFFDKLLFVISKQINEKDKVIQRLEARVKELEEQVAKLRT